MNVFVPRHVRLQTGSHPFIEYSRQENGVIRQRVYLTTATKVDRLPKNKLQIEFQNTDAAVSVDVKQAKQWIEDEALMATPKTTSCNSDKWVLRFETKQERDQWAKRLQDTIDLLAWISKFTVGQVIIESGASTLAECYSWLDQGQPSFIMKAMATSTKNLIATARQEIRIHHLLTNFSSHPNVLVLHDSFRQQERAYLVLEYCSGGDLFEHIHKEGALDETTAKALFRRIADAIAYIHGQNVVHLDIKPENLLFQSSPMNPETIKLADFGSAQLLADSSGLIKSTVSCTIGYAAPEVLDSGDVSFAADVFSAGAVLYTMLCGFAPFQSPSDEESMERTLRGDFSFDDPEWMTVSAQAKDLICGMLEVDPRERLSMEEVLGHPWLK
jgi:serine/threonine protein kinase